MKTFYDPLKLLEGSNIADVINVVGPDLHFSELQPGDLLWWVGKADYEWALCCPKCGKVGILKRPFEVREDMDWKVSVRPSIKCPVPGCGAHYLINKNRIIKMPE